MQATLGRYRYSGTHILGARRQIHGEAVMPVSEPHGSRGTAEEVLLGPGIPVGPEDAVSLMQQPDGLRIILGREQGPPARAHAKRALGVNVEAGGAREQSLRSRPVERLTDLDAKQRSRDLGLDADCVWDVSTSGVCRDDDQQLVVGVFDQHSRSSRGIAGMPDHAMPGQAPQPYAKPVSELG